jgi:hypothetical protein
MDAEVLGVEVRQYVGQGMKTLVPRVIGQTAAAEGRKDTSARQWDETSFFEDLTARTGLGEASAARAILDWARARGAKVRWGRGAKDGSFTPFLVHDGRDYPPVAVYTYGRVEVQFQHLMARPPFDRPEMREALRDRLNGAPGVAVPEDALARRPSIELSVLAADDATLQGFLAALDWLDDVAARGPQAQASVDATS